MLLGILLGTSVLMSYIAARSTYYILKFIAGAMWVWSALQWLASAPVTPGTPVDQAGVVILFIAGLAFIFMPFWFEKGENGTVVGRGFRMTWRRLTGNDDENSAPARRSYQERSGDYRERVNNALYGQRQAPRYQERRGRRSY